MYNIRITCTSFLSSEVKAKISGQGQTVTRGTARSHLLHISKFLPHAKKKAFISIQHWILTSVVVLANQSIQSTNQPRRREQKRMKLTNRTSKKVLVGVVWLSILVTNMLLTFVHATPFTTIGQLAAFKPRQQQQQQQQQICAQQKECSVFSSRLVSEMILLRGGGEGSSDDEDEDDDESTAVEDVDEGSDDEEEETDEEIDTEEEEDIVS